MYYFKDDMIAVAQEAYPQEMTSANYADNGSKYIPFTAEQTAFKEAHPEACAAEVLALEMTSTEG